MLVDWVFSSCNLSIKRNVKEQKRNVTIFIPKMVSLDIVCTNTGHRRDIAHVNFLSPSLRLLGGLLSH